MVSDVGKVLISFTVLEVNDLKNTFSFLQKYISFFKLVFFDELVGNISKF